MNPQTIILGGGITGMVSAYHALLKNSEVSLFEKKDRLGGMIFTRRSDLGIIESAANGFILTDEIKDILTSLNLDFIKTKKESRKRYFYKNQKASQLPVSIFELCKALYGLYFKDSSPNLNENFFDWSCRLFGKSTTINIIEPAIGGIYASDLKSLDPKMVFQNLDWDSDLSIFQRFRKKRNRKRTYGLVSFEKGMSEIISALENSIRPNSRIYLKTKAPSLSELKSQKKDLEIHVCLSLGECREYLEKNGYKLPQMHLLNVSTVTCFYKERLLKNPGFGLLFPKQEGIEANGVLFNSDIFEGRTYDPQIHSESWIYAGKKLENITDATLLKMQSSDRGKILGKLIDPLQSFVTQWKESFPIYDRELMIFNERLDVIEAEWKRKNIRLIFKGNYRRGIGLRSLFEMASL